MKHNYLKFETNDLKTPYRLTGMLQNFVMSNSVDNIPNTDKLKSMKICIIRLKYEK